MSKIPSLIKRIIPLRLKKMAKDLIRASVHRVYIEEWTKLMYIPLDQKLVQLEAKIRKLEQLVENGTALPREPIEQCLIKTTAEQKETENLETRFSINQKFGESGTQSKSSLQQEDIDLLESTIMDVGIVPKVEQSLKNEQDSLLSDVEYALFQKRFHQSFESHNVGYMDKILSYSKNATDVVEVGCGQGELLGYLKKQLPHANYIGIDTNKAMIEGGLMQGIDGILDDAVSALSAIPDDSIDTIYAMHMVEHLSVTYLRNMLEESFRSLKQDGRLIIETPNIQSLFVLSHYYYADHTHKMPRHPSLYVYILETIGFRQVNLDFVGEPPSELRLDESGSSLAGPDLEKINGMLFSAGNNVLLEAIK